VCLLVNFHRRRRSIGLPGVYVSTASVSSIFQLNCDWKPHLVQHGQSRVPQPIHRSRKIRNTAFETGLLGLRDPVLVDSRPTKIERPVQEPRANIYAESNVWPFFQVGTLIFGLSVFEPLTFVEEVEAVVNAIVLVPIFPRS